MPREASPRGVRRRRRTKRRTRHQPQGKVPSLMLRLAPAGVALVVAPAGAFRRVWGPRRTSGRA